MFNKFKKLISPISTKSINFSDRVLKIGDYLEKPYGSLIKYYLENISSQRIQGVLKENAEIVALKLPEELQQKLPKITDDFTKLTIGNKLWDRITGDVVTVLSVLINKEVPGLLSQVDDDNKEFLLAVLMDMHTLVMTATAINQSDFKKMMKI